MWRNKIVALVAVAIIVALVRALAPSSGISDLAHQSTQLHLQLFGTSIYEYHSTKGQWPAQIDDLGQTSLPLKSPYWKKMLDDEVDVIVWHKNLKPDPKDNAGRILAYHNKGLISSMGQTWVCWGDLRTEYIKTEELRNYLENRKD
ncbi:MAG TPA: hypothetical protein VG097_16980 [Gemmata sp.]|jgi:hypothetical protein|nr:hypothetical protein [Gemmata sp.]